MSLDPIKYYFTPNSILDIGANTGQFFHITEIINIRDSVIINTFLMLKTMNFVFTRNFRLLKHFLKQKKSQKLIWGKSFIYFGRMISPVQFFLERYVPKFDQELINIYYKELKDNE